LGNSVDQLQTGSINLQVSNNTGVDWALYAATVATPRNNPAATSVILDGGGTVMLDVAAAIGRLEVGGAASGKLQIASTGLVTVAGDYSQAVNGVVQFELGASDSGAITAAGQVYLAGSLEVSLETGFSPAVGDSFALIGATSVLGEFDQAQLPELAEDFTWHLEYDSTEVILKVLYSADFNADSLVGPEDLAIWQAAYGVSGQGDADGDGDTDGRDYLIWQRQVGSSAFGPAQASTVPEPHVSAVLGLAVMGLLQFRSGPRAKRRKP
jgi:hypothetical protein